MFMFMPVCHSFLLWFCQYKKLFNRIDSGVFNEHELHLFEEMLEQHLNFILFRKSKGIISSRQIGLNTPLPPQKQKKQNKTKQKNQKHRCWKLFSKILLDI